MLENSELPLLVKIFKEKFNTEVAKTILNYYMSVALIPQDEVILKAKNEKDKEFLGSIEQRIKQVSDESSKTALEIKALLPKVEEVINGESDNDNESDNSTDKDSDIQDNSLHQSSSKK